MVTFGTIFKNKQASFSYVIRLKYYCNELFSIGSSLYLYIFFQNKSLFRILLRCYVYSMNYTVLETAYFATSFISAFIIHGTENHLKYAD